MVVLALSSLRQAQSVLCVLRALVRYLLWAWLGVGLEQLSAEYALAWARVVSQCLLLHLQSHQPSVQVLQAALPLPLVV